MYQIYRIDDGQVVAQSQEMRALRPRLTPQDIAAAAAGPALGDISTPHGRVRLVNTVLSSEDGRRYLVQVGTPLEPLDSALAGFLDTLAVVLPISLLAAAYLGWLMAGRALSPVKVAARVAENITAAQLNRRLPVRGADDELDHLSAAFNRTLARLETAVGEMKQFTASITHELRTPLTVLRGEAEIALMQRRGEEDYSHVLSSQLEEIDKLIRMINQMLTLARAESGDIQLQRQTVNLSNLAADLVRDMRPWREKKKLCWSSISSETSNCPATPVGLSGCC